MELNKILSANFLDILFDGRNKNYGAYELRTNYNKRLAIALVITASIAALLFLLIFIANLHRSADKGLIDIDELKLANVKLPPPAEELPPPPPPPPPPAAAAKPLEMAMEKYTLLKIVKDEDVREDEKPPKNEDLADVKIGIVKQEGEKDLGIVTPPPGDGGKGVVLGPARKVDYADSIFQKVEIESEFSTGAIGWKRYLERNLNFPERAREDGISGTVRVQFVVDRDGNVSNVTALDNPGGGLAEEAVRIIRKSGKWKPAIQNGIKVNSYKIQPLSFRLQ